MERKIIVCDLCNRVITNSINYTPETLRGERIDLCDDCVKLIRTRQVANNISIVKSTVSFILPEEHTAVAVETNAEDAAESVIVEAKPFVLESHATESHAEAVSEASDEQNEEHEEETDPAETEEPAKEDNPTEDVPKVLEGFEELDPEENSLQKYPAKKKKKRGAYDKSGGHRGGQVSNKKLDDGTLKALYEANRTEGPWTAGELAIHFGCTQQTIYNHLNKMAKEGKIVLRGMNA